MPTSPSAPARSPAKKPAAPVRKRAGAGDALLAQIVTAPGKLERPPAPAGGARPPAGPAASPPKGRPKRAAPPVRKARAAKPAAAPAPRATPPAPVAAAPVSPAPNPPAEGSSALARIEQMARGELADIDSRMAVLAAERVRVVGVLTAIGGTTTGGTAMGGSVEPAAATPPALPAAASAAAAPAALPAAPAPTPAPAAAPAIPPGLAAAQAALARPHVTQPDAVLAVMERATGPLSKPQIFELVRQVYPPLSITQPVLNTVVQRLRKEGKIANASYGYWILAGRAPAAATPVAAHLHTTSDGRLQQKHARDDREFGL